MLYVIVGVILIASAVLAVLLFDEVRHFTVTRVALAGRFGTLRQSARDAVRSHPVKAFGVIESGFWALIFLSMLDHLASISGPTGTLVYYLTIGWHEIGHIICMPFGQFLYTLGGSFWQVQLWVLLAVYLFVGYRRVSDALVMWAIAGHSLINLAPYIGDARARKLPLLFGMGPEHHDWWNLLGQTNLLEYDTTFATLARLLGIAILLSAVTGGILTAWALPRTRLGKFRRF